MKKSLGTGLKSVVCLLMALLISLPCGINAFAEIKEETAAPIAGISGYAPSAAEQQAMSVGFLPVIAKDGLTILFKQETAEIALYSAAADRLVYSNPQDIPADSKGTPFHRMSSQLYITYYENNSQIKFYSSRFDSLERNQMTPSLKDDVLSVNYVFGKRKITKQMIPAAIPEEKFEKLLEKLDDDGKKSLKMQFKRISADDFISADTKEKYKQSYKNFEETPLYILNKYIPDYELEPVYVLLEQAGYTSKDLKEDNKASGNEVEIADTNVVFDLTLNYFIKDGALKVELDCSRLNVLDNADIASINVLEFFGCGSVSDTGYVLVPDGSGGLIDFNSSKSGAAAYSGKIFGNDQTIRDNGLSDNETGVQLPVLGINKNDSGIFAVVGEGAEYCSINADIADDIIPFNVGYVRADINPFDKMSVASPIHGGGMTQIFVRQKEPYKGKVSISYYVLESGKNTYSDMASLYRAKLEKDGVLKDKLSGEVPFIYSVVGAIDVKKHFLGIPYVGKKSLTTFEQAGEIAKELSDDGIKDQHMRYIAWFNGGMKQTVADKVKIESVLGGKKGLTALNKTKGVTLYPNVSFTTATNTLFDSFSVKKDAARLTYNETALLYPISIPKNFFDYNSDYSYIVSVKRYDEYITKFSKNYNLENLAVDDISRYLNSDFTETRYAERASSLKITDKALSTLSGKYKLMASAPNLYAIDNTGIMVDMPIGTSGDNIISLQIPFLQMVISGYKDMACSPINISYGDFSVANLLSFATLPNYTFIKESSSVIMNTNYTELYSVCFDDWKKQAVETYNAVAQVAQKVRGVSIKSHNFFESGLCELVYENGITLIINNTDSAVDYADSSIEAGEYILKEAGR